MGHVARDEPEEEEIDGLRLPFDLNSHAAVSYVLQQQVSHAVRLNKRWEELAAKIPLCCKRLSSNSFCVISHFIIEGRWKNESAVMSIAVSIDKHYKGD